MLLHDVDQRTVALHFEARVILSTSRGNTCDELRGRKLRAETAQHFGIKRIIEIEDVARVRIQHDDDFHSEMICRGLHPADARHKSFPVRLLITKRQKCRSAEARLARVIDEFFLAGPGPLGVQPGGSWCEVIGF